MNGLGWVLLWSAVPITIVAAVALVLERLASRRGPVAGSWVLAASLCVIVVVTPLAVCGLPQRWSWRMLSLFTTEEVTSIGGSLPGRSSSSVDVATGGAPRSVDADSAVSGLDWPRAWWHRLREARPRRSARFASEPASCKKHGGLLCSRAQRDALGDCCLASGACGTVGGKAMRSMIPMWSPSSSRSVFLVDRATGRGSRAVVIDRLDGRRGRLAAAFRLASARLAILESPRAQRGAGSRNGPHRSR